MNRPFKRSSLILLPVIFISILWTSCRQTNSDPTPARYATAIEMLTSAIEYEMEDKSLPALSIVLVDDQEVVWAKSFGREDPAREKPADLYTVFRIGSVSKLFTDIAVMQLVEKGEVHLDTSIQVYLPDFQPANPYKRSITLRQLMSHRSGLLREPRMGHYFDEHSPTLAQTVNSLNEAPLIYEPETRVKYSNAGIAVVGYMLEKLKNKPFADYLQEEVIQPIGLINSTFKPTIKVKDHLAVGEMWSYDGRKFNAPTFELGMAPAGSMYATITDLGKFLSVLFNGGQGENGRVLQPQTLEQMWSPQFETESSRNYGLGFRLDEQSGYRRVGHGGAIYGFATQLYALPDQKLGAAAVITADGANTISNRLTEYALDLMLAVNTENPLPAYSTTEALIPELSKKYDGHYRNGDDVLLLENRSGVLTALYHGVESRVKSSGPHLILDDRITYGLEIYPQADGSLTLRNERYERFSPAVPSACPKKYEGLIGEYGWDFNVLFIYEDAGKLYALVEWFDKYALTEIDENTFAFPDEGLYHGEQLVFTRNAQGIATQAEIPFSVVFPRRQNIDAAETFRIQPLLSAHVLRDSALRSQPPAESASKAQPDLVELIRLDPSIKLDIRYATTNNFMGAVFYQQARAFLQRPAAEALVRAHQKLAEQGFGLLIYDGYRPWYVTKMFWDATPDDKRIFVADPSRGSRHNRGCAVDLTLYDRKTGKAILMPAGYDEMTERSYPYYVGGTSLQRWRREVLRKAMEAEGFTVYDYEWWHFDYNAWRDYPILNVRFEEMK